MRQLADTSHIRKFMRAMGEAARSPARLYFTGGATAVLVGWRDSTIDVDILIRPEQDALLQNVPGLKDQLQLNVELACPADFIPEVPGWEDRSLFVAQEGKLGFYHYDPYSQCLAKIERGHTQDVMDVRAMVERGMVQPDRLLALFDRIEPDLYRYPAIDPGSFRRAVHEVVSQCGGGDRENPG